MDDRREEVSEQLRAQQQQLSSLEEKLSQLLERRRGSGDSGTITWSDEDTLTQV